MILGVDIGTGLDITVIAEYKNGRIVGYKQDRRPNFGKSPIEKCLPNILKLDDLQKKETL